MGDVAEIMRQSPAELIGNRYDNAGASYKLFYISTQRKVSECIKHGHQIDVRADGPNGELELEGFAGFLESAPSSVSKE